MRLNANPEPNVSHSECNLQVVEIFISAGHDYWSREGAGRLQHGIQRVSQAECVAGRGLKSDRYFDAAPSHPGQVTLMTLEAIEEIRLKFRLPKLPAGIFRRNVVVCGGNLSELLGRQFQIQGVLFEGCQECRPCHWMELIWGKRHLGRQFKKRVGEK